MDGPIRNARGERLEHDWHRAGAGDGPVVVLGHGVTANKDRPFLVALAEGLAAAGVPCLRFSFAGNGGSEGRFEDATITKEVEDLGAVLGALGGRPAIYVGHSMGAAVGCLRAVVDPRVVGLVSLGGMVDVADFVERKFGALVPGRDRMWDKPDCPLSQAFMDDARAIGSLRTEAGNVKVPWLLVHGTADEVVPPRDSEQALAAAGRRARLELLDGADHVFTGDATPRMVAVAVPWIAERAG